MEKVYCPKCSGEMRYRVGMYGEFFGCSNYPECNGTLKADSKGRPIGGAQKPKKTIKEEVKVWADMLYPFMSKSKILEIVGDTSNATDEKLKQVIEELKDANRKRINQEALEYKREEAEIRAIKKQVAKEKEKRLRDKEMEKRMP